MSPQIFDGWPSICHYAPVAFKYSKNLTNLILTVKSKSVKMSNSPPSKKFCASDSHVFWHDQM